MSPVHGFSTRLVSWLDQRFSTAPIMYALGKRYYKRNRFGDAIKAFAQAEAGLALRLGPDHPHVIAAVVNLAASYDASGDPATACRHYARALDAMQRTEQMATPLAQRIRVFIAENCK